MLRFDDKVAIVTGAAGGIGEAYARRLAVEGANVVVADVAEEQGEKVAAEITASEGGDAHFVRVDISDPASTSAMAEATVERFGGIDLLVNNAAIYGDMEFDMLLTVDWDYYRKIMDVNMHGALLCTRAVYKHMTRRGGGAIVNQSSTAAWLYSGFYGLAKVGINGLTQQLAHELGGRNIRINAIVPVLMIRPPPRSRPARTSTSWSRTWPSSARAPSTTWRARASSCSPMTPLGSPARS